MPQDRLQGQIYPLKQHNTKIKQCSKEFNAATMRVLRNKLTHYEFTP